VAPTSKTRQGCLIPALCVESQMDIKGFSRSTPTPKTIACQRAGESYATANAHISGGCRGAALPMVQRGCLSSSEDEAIQFAVARAVVLKAPPSGPSQDRWIGAGVCALSGSSSTRFGALETPGTIGKEDTGAAVAG